MLSPEPALAARLAEIDGLKGVYGLPELAPEAMGKLAPCAYLIFDGYAIEEHSGDRRQARVRSRWLVVLAVKHAGRAGDGAPARAAATPLVSAVIGKLLGWRGAGMLRPLELAPAPRAEFHAGTLFFPLAFTCAHNVSGER